MDIIHAPVCHSYSRDSLGSASEDVPVQAEDNRAQDRRRDKERLEINSSIYNIRLDYPHVDA